MSAIHVVFCYGPEANGWRGFCINAGLSGTVIVSLQEQSNGGAVLHATVIPLSGYAPPMQSISFDSLAEAVESFERKKTDPVAFVTKMAL